VKDVNGLTMRVLEAGFEAQNCPCVLLLHGFPELAYSWRKVMLPLAAAGYHVVAPDQRGYGQTTGWDGDYDGDVGSFRLLNIVRDALALVSALGYRSVAAVVGHDFGSPVAACCALIRPDVFQSVVLMSAPFGGPPPLPFDTANLAIGATAGDAPGSRIHGDLAALNPPRKHYQWYYSSRVADHDMRHCPQGIRSRSSRGAPRSLLSCRPTTSWKRTRGWPKRLRPRCRPPARSRPACGFPTRSCASTARPSPEPGSRVDCSGIAA
jgi:pimeloyl-ACP methyl ester carboxylesterase